MILTCPQCATQYKVDAAKFPPAGRTVRCAKCSHSWHQDAAVAEAPPPAALQPVFVAPPPEQQIRPEPQVEPAPPPRRAAFVAPPVVVEEPECHEPVAAPVVPAATARPPRPATSRGGSVLAAFGWVVLVGLVLVIGVSAVTFRQAVAQAWPRTASVYAALGMKVNPYGIGFADVTHSQQTEDGQSVLAITGKLVNLTARRVSVPPIEVRLIDNARHVVLRKSFAANVATLAPGQATSFLARLSSPPAAARHMELHFAGQ